MRKEAVVTLIKFAGFGYPEFRVDVNYDTEYFIKPSEDKDWVQVDRDTYRDAP